MSLLIDLFGYLSIILHGLTILAQSTALGGVIFLAVLARPLAGQLGIVGPLLLRDTVRIVLWAALGLILCEGSMIALQTAVLVGTIDLPVTEALGAEFVIAGMVKIACMAVLIGALWGRGGKAPTSLLFAACVIALAAATLTTHAAARLTDRGPLLLVEALHQLGAAIWVGGLPCFIAALARVHDGRAWRAVGERFSRMSMVGVGCILISGTAMSVLYIGSLKGFYGTAYGVMVGAKDRHVPDAARARRRQFPARRAAPGRSQREGDAAEAFRRGRTRHRRQPVLRRGLAHLGAAGDRPAAGPGNLAGDRRAEHAALAAPGVAGSRCARLAGAAGRP